MCEQVGFPPDPEQRLILDDLFAVGGDGLSAAFETAVVATRQQLKTGLMKQAAIGWLFVTQEETVTWSAHLFPTTQDAFRDLTGLLTNSPMLRKRLATGPTNGIHGGRGSENIELRDGRRLLFRARTKTGGRGLTGDKMILDEAFALQPDHLGALIPTLTAVPDPQLLYGSSAGMGYSHILREIRNRGQAGSPGLAYAEWCARRKACASEKCEHWKPSHPLHDPGCALDDEDLWREASPLLGRQRSNGTGLTLVKMRKFREAEPPEEWMRERLGWWDEGGAAEIFGIGGWEGRLAPYQPGLPVAALGVAVSLDLSHAAVVAAAINGEKVVVRPLKHGPGTDWVVASLKELQRQHRAPAVIDGRGPGAGLIPHLQAAGVAVNVATTAQVLDACAQVYTLVVDARLEHAGYSELDAAVEGAVKRDVQDRWAWGRRSSTADISPLEAATLAVWWAARPTVVPPPPPGPQVAPASTVRHEIATAGF